MKTMFLPLQSDETGCGFMDVTFMMNQSFVYVLMSGDEIIYIGQSKAIGLRTQSHRRDKSFDRVYALPCLPDEAFALEAALIRAVQPKLNVVHAERGRVKGDTELLLRHKILSHESSLLKTAPFEQGFYGHVVICEGSRMGKVGYYDDDDFCDDSLEDLAVVYFGSRDSGYELVSFDSLLSVGDKPLFEIKSAVGAHA